MEDSLESCLTVAAAEQLYDRFGLTFEVAAGKIYGLFIEYRLDNIRK